MVDLLLYSGSAEADGSNKFLAGDAGVGVRMALGESADCRPNRLALWRYRRGLLHLSNRWALYAGIAEGHMCRGLFF